MILPTYENGTHRTGRTKFIRLCDLEAFQKIHVKYNENCIREFIEWANKDASVRELASQILNFTNIITCSNIKDHINQLYCGKTGWLERPLLQNSKNVLILEKTPKETEYFIRIYLENPDETYKDIR